MSQIELSEAEVTTLQDVLDSYLSELRMEIADTDQREFREGLKGMANPYGDGQAAGRMLEVLREVPLDERLLVKEAF